MFLARLSTGDTQAAEQLFPLVYDQLRGLADSFFRVHVVHQTLQPTALVHEAYLRLVGDSHTAWQSRAHFFAVAAKAMRHILTDHARRRRAEKRGGDAQRLTLTGLPDFPDGGELDMLDLDDALTRLAELSPRQARIVELRFFGGLLVAEVASLLGLADRTVDREWRLARAWLRQQLEPE